MQQHKNSKYSWMLLKRAGEGEENFIWRLYREHGFDIVCLVVCLFVYFHFIQWDENPSQMMNSTHLMFAISKYTVVIRAPDTTKT